MPSLTRDTREENIAGAASCDWLLALARLMASHQSVQSLVEAISAATLEKLPHDHLEICVIEGRAHIVYEARVQSGWSGAATKIALSRSPLRDLLLGRVPFILSTDTTVDARFTLDRMVLQRISQSPLRSRLNVPLLIRGTIIGALSFSKLESDIYSDGDIDLVQHLAVLVAPHVQVLQMPDTTKRIAIEEAESRAREEALRESALRLTEELERERQRIGMDLHDQTLADLTRITRRIMRMQTEPDVSPEALDLVANGLQRCMADLREIIDDARPNVLELFGFADGMEDFLGRTLMETGTGIRGHFTDDTQGAIDTYLPTLRVALFRIVQEAINNAAHHAEPSLIEVDMRVETSSEGTRRVVIAVRDDGIGLPRAHQKKRLGGIRNMQTRARLVAAQFTMEPGLHGRGTTITLTMPIPPAQG